MKILYIGDIMAGPGRRVVTQVLPELKKKHEVDFVIAQGENMAHGKSPRRSDIEEMQKTGVDFFTGGNHSLTNPATNELYEDGEAPIIRPANIIDAQGEGWKIVETEKGKVFIASILGQTVGSQKLDLDNPLKVIDEILNTLSNNDISALIVNFHGDYSSEKKVFGYYLDGRVSAVIGDHWHIPTADAQIMPKGTAHITDVGMCGTLHSSLGVKTEVIAERWYTGKSSKNEIEEDGPLQFNAVMIDIDESTGLARSIEHIQQIIDQNS